MALSKIDAANFLDGTLPDTNINNASLDNVTGLPAGIGGKVLQAVTSTTQTQSNTTSTSFVATALNANITPSSTSSKILIMVAFSQYAASGDARSTIYRDSTNLFDATKGMSSIGNTDAFISSCTLDSPNTTSQVTYTAYHNVASGTSYFLPAGNLTATMTLLEIAS